MNRVAAIVLGGLIGAAPAANAQTTDTIRNGVHYTDPSGMDAALITPQVIAANRLGIITLCFKLRILNREPEPEERLIRQRWGTFSPVAETARVRGLNRYVLQADGRFVDFYTVAARYNTTGVRLCDDLVESEHKGGPDADRIPSREIE